MVRLEQKLTDPVLVRVKEQRPPYIMTFVCGRFGDDPTSYGNFILLNVSDDDRPAPESLVTAVTVEPHLPV